MVTRQLRPNSGRRARMDTPARLYLRHPSFGKLRLPMMTFCVFQPTHVRPLFNRATRMLTLLACDPSDVNARPLMIDCSPSAADVRYVHLTPLLRSLGFAPGDADSLALPWQMDRDALLIGPFPEPEDAS